MASSSSTIDLSRIPIANRVRTRPGRMLCGPGVLKHLHKRQRHPDEVPPIKPDIGPNPVAIISKWELRSRPTGRLVGMHDGSAIGGHLPFVMLDDDGAQGGDEQIVETGLGKDDLVVIGDLHPIANIDVPEMDWNDHLNLWNSGTRDLYINATPSAGRFIVEGFAEAPKDVTQGYQWDCGEQKLVLTLLVVYCPTITLLFHDPSPAFSEMLEEWIQRRTELLTRHTPELVYAPYRFIATRATVPADQTGGLPIAAVIGESPEQRELRVVKRMAAQILVASRAAMRATGEEPSSAQVYYMPV